MPVEQAVYSDRNAAWVGGGILGAAPNFRDIGNLPAADGRLVRTGLVYRSGALDELDADDVATLRTLGIRLCLDLRSRGERINHPSRWPEDCVPRILALEVATDIRALDQDLGTWLMRHPDRAGATRLMRSIYRSMPLSCAPVLSRLFTELVEGGDAQPLLVHCAAGKDRTGFVVAMLLKALGVDDAPILADYLRSNQHYDGLRQDAKISALLESLFGVRLDADALEAITCADPSYLDCAFEEIGKSFGSIDQYLQTCAGLDDRLRNRLRQSLLTPAVASG